MFYSEIAPQQEWYTWADPEPTVSWHDPALPYIGPRKAKRTKKDRERTKKQRVSRRKNRK